MKRTVFLALVLALCVIFTVSATAQDKASASQKAKNFWQKLFNYPANVAKDSTEAVSSTAKRGTDVVAKEVSTVGQVTSGDAQKAKDLIVEPITGTADTAVKAVQETASVPVTAAEKTNQ